MKKIKILLCMIFWICVCNIYAQHPEFQDNNDTYTLARTDAIRRITEMIQEIQISSKAKVKDFVAESDEIRNSLKTFVEGIRETKSPVYNSDGSCQVTLEVSVYQIIDWLQTSWFLSFARTVPSPVMFKEIVKYTPRKIFRVTGRGYKKEKTIAFSRKDIWAKVSPRGKLLALRAAKVDAYRNLAQVIQGIRLTSNTTVRDVISENDEIRMQFNHIIQGAQFAGQPKYRSDGIVEVTAQVDLNKLFESLSKIGLQYLPERRWDPKNWNSFKKKIVQVVGTGLPPAKYMMPGPEYPDDENSR